MKNTHLSFEIYPPKTPEGFKTLSDRCNDLQDFEFDFLSVTSGAMGNQSNPIIKGLELLANDISRPLVPHITCTYGTKSELNALAEELWEKNYRTVVALRGDMPDGFTFTADHCHYATDLIDLLHKKYPFEIFVAAYPEKHPHSPSLEADIVNLKRKIDAGATGIFTQFFFDPYIFLDFRDKVVEFGIDVPLIAGLIPLHPYDKIKSFAIKCKTDIPGPIEDVFKNQEDGAEATAFLSEQCQQLVKGGADGFHFYCLNRPELITPTLKNLREFMKDRV